MSITIDELRELLARLGDEHESLSFSKLYALSDLSAAHMAEFRSSWNGYPVSRRQKLIRALAELGESSFEVTFDPIFRLAMADDDGRVRATAIDGLWENDNPVLIGPFLVALRDDPSPLVRAAAAGGLGRFVLAGELERLDASVQAHIVADLLTVVHSESQDVQVRCRALESVGYACVEEVQQAIELAYYSGTEILSASAITAMGRSCERRWLPIILQELQSDLPVMRYEAILACGEISARPAVPALAHLIQDPDREVGYAAIWALGQIGGEAAKQVLQGAYEGADEEMETALDEALAEHALADAELGSPVLAEDDLAELDSEYDGDEYDRELGSTATGDIEWSDFEDLNPDDLLDVTDDHEYEGWDEDDDSDTDVDDGT